MTVRAKFKCTKREEHSWGTDFAFSAVYTDDPNHENKAFWDATPSAQLAMTIANRAAQVFEAGKEYYLDFSEAPIS